MKKIACLFACLFAGSANATLIGDEISVSGSSFTPGLATIGAGAEFTFINDVFFDFGSDTLTITHDETGTHGWGDFGFVTFSGFDDIITGLSLASAVGMTGDILSDFSFTSDSLTFHTGISNSQSFGQVVFDITQTSVPEPASIALLGLGLVSFCFSRKKKNA